MMTRYSISLLLLLFASSAAGQDFNATVSNETIAEIRNQTLGVWSNESLPVDVEESNFVQEEEEQFVGGAALNYSNETALEQSLAEEVANATIVVVGIPPQSVDQQVANETAVESQNQTALGELGEGESLPVVESEEEQQEPPAKFVNETSVVESEEQQPSNELINETIPVMIQPEEPVNEISIVESEEQQPSNETSIDESQPEEMANETASIEIGQPQQPPENELTNETVIVAIQPEESANETSVVDENQELHSLEKSASELADTNVQQLVLGEYKTSTSVMDEAAIDLDQEEIVGIAYNIHNRDMEEIGAVYTRGGNSMPYASITLSAGLPQSCVAGASVRGQDVSGNEIQGTLLEAAPLNATRLSILYPSMESQAADAVVCRASSVFPTTTAGCFAAEGTLTIADSVVANYNDHDAATSTFGIWTIQKFSTMTNLHHRLEDPTEPVHENMQRFIDYYGTAEYADKFIMAAVAGEDTGLERGNMDFTEASDEAKVSAAKEATVVLNILMMVIRQMEHSLDLCENSAQDDDNAFKALNALDVALAFYAGSRAANGKSGHLLYRLAEVMCARMNTCARDETSKHNAIILSQFQVIQNHLVEGQCSEARIVADDVKASLYVPMIEGVMYFAHRQGEMGDATPRSNAEGAVYAAAVLPRLHECDSEAANIVYEQMRLGNSDPVKFRAVKRALENNLDCMAISCDDVGGVHDGKRYYNGARPCRIAGTSIAPDDDGVEVESGTSSNSNGLDLDARRIRLPDDISRDSGIPASVVSVLVVLGVFLVAGVMYFLYRRRTRLSSLKKMATGESDTEDETDNESLSSVLFV